MPITSKNLSIAYTLILIAMLLASTGPGIFSLLIKEMEPCIGVMYFLIFGGLFSLIISTIEIWWNKIDIKKCLSLSNSLKLLLSSFATAFCFLAYVYSMKSHSATLTILIVRIGPVFSVILAAIVLKEKIYQWWRVIISAILCVLGVCIMTDFSLNFSQTQIVEPFLWLALVAAFMGAFNTIIGREIQVKCGNKLPGTFIAGATLLLGGITILLWLVMTGKYHFQTPTHQNTLLLFWLGFGTVALPEIVSLKAYHIANSVTRFSFFDYFRPVFSISWVYVLAGEIQTDFYQMLMGFIIISIGIFSLNKSKL